MEGWIPLTMGIDGAVLKFETIIMSVNVNVRMYPRCEVSDDIPIFSHYIFT